MKKKKLKIGFDFDGVIMYNPVRVFRPIISIVKKKKLIGREELEFFVPESKSGKLFWLLAHQSSIFPARGLSELRNRVCAKEFECYLITGRNTYLGADLARKSRWFKLNNIFQKVFITQKNEQPHLFKERMLKELSLDYFVEDNWDIVAYLSKRKLKTKIIWLSNVLDKDISYPLKCTNLAEALAIIEGKK